MQLQLRALWLYKKVNLFFSVSFLTPGLMDIIFLMVPRQEKAVQNVFTSRNPRNVL